MAYPNDLLGKAIQVMFTRKAVPHPNPELVLGQHAHDLTVTVYNYTPGRPGVGGAPPIPPKFTTTGLPPWQISFLEYVPGEVTTVRLQRPVLTGPMSGCYLFRYTVGGPRIAHVGTHDLGPDSPLSVQAKNNWRAYVTQKNATDVLGVSPADFYSPGERGAKQVGRMGGVPEIYGLFEPGGTSYALLMAPMGTDTSPTIRKLYLVQGIKQMNLLQWSAISALRTFR